MSRNEPAPRRAGLNVGKSKRFGIITEQHNGVTKTQWLPPGTTVGQARAQRAKLGAQSNMKSAMIIEKWEDK